MFTWHSASDELACITEVFGSEFVLEQTEDHAYRYYQEACAPVDILAKIAGDQWS